MAGNVLVLAEHWNGQPESVTLQLLTKGRELADAMGVALEVLVVGHDIGSVAEALRNRGADTIFTADEVALARAACGLQAEVAVAALQQIAPALTLVGYTLVGMELGPAIATRLSITAMTKVAVAEPTESSGAKPVRLKNNWFAAATSSGRNRRSQGSECMGG